MNKLIPCFVLLCLSDAGQSAATRGKPLAPLDPYYVVADKAHRANIDEVSDQFASSFDGSSFVGRSFKLRLIPEENVRNDFKTASFYYYEDGRLSLNFFSKGGGRFVVRSRSAPFGSYVGQNGFGARVRVSRVQVITDALVVSGSANDYQWSQSVSGPEARAMSRDLAVVVEGRLADLKSGKLTECTANAVSATLHKPYDVLKDSCDVGGILTRVAFIRRSTGMVLKEWIVEGP